MTHPLKEVSFPSTYHLVLWGWFVPAAAADALAILYAPATAQDQRSGLSRIPAFHQAGYHVLLFSYRGHALSDGKRGAFTYGDAESWDVDAAVRFLHETKGIGQIGVVGHSVGDVSAILSAARNPRAGAVIAVAPFTCTSDIWYTSRPSLVPPFVLDWTLWVAEKRRGFEWPHLLRRGECPPQNGHIPCQPAQAPLCPPYGSILPHPGLTVKGDAQPERPPLVRDYGI